jgi:hypothetical protein
VLCWQCFGGFNVQKTYQARFFAMSLGISLGVSLLLPVAAQAAIVDHSVPTARELASERFQLPSPMSREYMQVLRSAPMHYEAPVDMQTPAQPRPKPETN